MIEKKEVAKAVRETSTDSGAMLHGVTENEVNRPMVLVRAMHISPAGLRTRRSQTGNHGASGVEKPLETRSREVATCRNVGSLGRQLPGGHASKVRCRSRCGANHSILQVVRQPQAKAADFFGTPSQTGRCMCSLVSRSLLQRLPFARKKLPASRVAAPKRQAKTQVARFPARCTCPEAVNRQARWRSA